MIYLDNGATSFHKPESVHRAVQHSLRTCANPGRGGYGASMAAAREVFACRQTASELFDCDPEQVVFTSNCTHGLNLAIHSLVKPGATVAITGFEHNAVLRPLVARSCRLQIGGRKLFDWEDTLESFEKALRGADAAVFTHVSNVFGYILPVEEMARMCRDKQIPFVVDAAQSAGPLPVKLRQLGADFIAMPGHKGLLGPQGTGLLLCSQPGQPLLYGGTGSASKDPCMPPDLPERLEAGTLNVPGIAGLRAGLTWLRREGIANVFRREHIQMRRCAAGLDRLGYQVFTGDHQAGTVSFLPGTDCQEAADRLGQQGIALRAGLHCAPLAHESAGTLDTGTVRISFGHDANPGQVKALISACAKVIPLS